MLGSRFERGGWRSPGWFGIVIVQVDPEFDRAVVPWIERDTPQGAGVPLRGSGMECPKDSVQSDGNPVAALSGERSHLKECCAVCNRSYD